VRASKPFKALLRAPRNRMLVADPAHQITQPAAKRAESRSRCFQASAAGLLLPCCIFISGRSDCVIQVPHVKLRVKAQVLLPNTRFSNYSQEQHDEGFVILFLASSSSAVHAASKPALSSAFRYVARTGFR